MLLGEVVETDQRWPAVGTSRNFSAAQESVTIWAWRTSRTQRSRFLDVRAP